MTRPRILLQLDSDAHASVFDAITAVDAGVEHLLQYQDVEPTQVRELVHGAMFTRGPDDLHQTAIFIGGSNVAAGEALLQLVRNCFFGPMRVSVMLDANGANTTAVAAVIAASRHLDLPATTAAVLGGTGPVGQRVAQLLASRGARVRVASRRRSRAESVCATVAERVAGAQVTPFETAQVGDVDRAVDGCQLVVAAGAAGVVLLSHDARRRATGLRVAVDLNAVPPLGMEGVEVLDRATDHDGAICYGAIGVGGMKMKIHKAALCKMFESNDCVLDANELLAIGMELEQ